MSDATQHLGGSEEDAPELRPRFRLLGPLEVAFDGRPQPPSGEIPACVLGILLLERGHVVPIHRLAAAVWDQDLPATASHQVQKAISILRSKIPGGRHIVTTVRGGYRLDIPEEDSDAGLLAIRLRRARQAEAAGLPGNAVAEYQAALGLWRGSVLQGIGGVTLAGASRGLEELRMRIAEDYLSLRARLGESASLVSELRALIEQEPLRESLRHQVILALYRCGRQAEALDEFTAIHELLADELGISPSAELTTLHEAILRQDPALQSPPPPPPPANMPYALPTAWGTAQAPKPNTLPYDLRDFVGRAEELRLIMDLGNPDAGMGTRILALDGMGGVGKTAIAVHAAHQLAAKFLDGQLYVDLHGYTPGGVALRSDDALDHLLRVMGVASEQLPEDYATKVALWRSITAQLRMLLVLDNATDSDQVRDLIPGSPHCLVIATSRSRLMDISGAQWITLNVMPEADCTAFLYSILGQDRVAAEPDALADLIQLCGRLPLALRIAASRLARRQEWTVRHLAALLSDEKRTTRELTSGHLSVAVTLTLSYNTMPDLHRSAFRLLALHPGTTFSRQCAAAILDTSPEETDQIIEHILDTHLIEQHSWDRYYFHDLARSFALTLAEEGTQPLVSATESSRTGFEERLAQHYVHASTRACDILFPGRVRYAFSDKSPNSRQLPDFCGKQDALTWFEAEEAAIKVVLDIGVRCGLHEHTGILARNFSFYLNSQGYYDKCQSAGAYAVDAARKLTDQSLLCVSLTNLALAEWQIGNSARATALLDEALGIARFTRDEQLEAAALSRLGLVHWSLAQFPEALTAYEEAVILHRQHGNDREAAETLGNMCEVLVLLGRAEDAITAGTVGADLAHHIGDQAVESAVLTEVAYAHGVLGSLTKAMECADLALKLAASAQGPLKIAAALLCRGTILLRTGVLDEAEQCAEQALGLAQAREVRSRRAMAENLLGRIHTARGNPAAALAFHQHAQVLAEAASLLPVAAEAKAGAAIAIRALSQASG